MHPTSSFVTQRKVNKDKELTTITDQTPLLFPFNPVLPPNDILNSYPDNKNAVPWKTIFIIFFLFFIGTLSSIIAAFYYFRIPSMVEHENLHWPSFAIIGILCLIPGGFFLIHILLALLRVRGYFLSDLPQI